MELILIGIILLLIVIATIRFEYLHRKDIKEFDRFMKEQEEVSEELKQKRNDRKLSKQE